MRAVRNGGSSPYQRFLNGWHNCLMQCAMSVLRGSPIESHGALHGEEDVGPSVVKWGRAPRVREAFGARGIDHRLLDARCLALLERSPEPIEV